MVLCRDFYTDVQLDALLKQYPGQEVYSKWLPERVLVVAEQEGEITGFAQMNPATCSIEALHVNPEQACRGIGRSLTGEIERIAADMGIKKLVLDSSVNADGFYARCGYTRKGEGMFRCNSGIELEIVTYEKEL